jgi:hypothetical protein
VTFEALDNVRRSIEIPEDGIFGALWLYYDILDLYPVYGVQLQMLALQFRGEGNSKMVE